MLVCFFSCLAPCAQFFFRLSSHTVIISGDSVLDQYRHFSLLIFDSVQLHTIKGSLSFGLGTAPAIDRHEGNHFVNSTGI